MNTLHRSALRLTGLACALACAFVGTSISSADSSWVLQRDSQGICYVAYVQASPADPTKVLLATYPTQKNACRAAKCRFDPDKKDTNLCWTYESGAIDACGRKEDVDLPK